MEQRFVTGEAFWYTSVYEQYDLPGVRVRLAQSIKRQGTGWTSQVQFQAVEDFSHLHSIQTDSVANTASCPLSSRGSA
jgi:hypothetical protein